ncbi:transcriptional regulator [Dictyobacter alpinus]|uniref:Transcriptional regulator n=1 Tax=Dictyobacter alpinus TaxID=2014873 RepID=A0A402BGM7_9CHLR|nr:MarR family transcriptional regulator [Dictyobacter alpinus]GCE30523.1 transcriptional regulator [Dictyobacter alpinus]
MTTERLTEDLLLLTRLLRPSRHTDMTQQQYWLLRHLRCHEPQGISELAQALGITTGSATVACQRLEKAGLITRRRQEDDERVVHVSLTEQGRQQIDAVRQQRREALTHLLQVLDEPEQQELQRLVERLLDAAEAQGLGEMKKHDSHH